MIKCDLTLCAVISRAAAVKKDKNDNSFLSFGVRIPIEGRDGARKDLDISVSVDGDKSKTGIFALNRRVNITGVMNIVKRDGRMFCNLRASSAELANSQDSNHINGTMEFRGKVSKQGIEEKKDKKDNTYKAFSAFSSDKHDDKVEFTWVRFLYFNPKDGEDFLQANAYIEAKGELQLGVFKDAISLDCRVSEVKPWILERHE